MCRLRARRRGRRSRSRRLYLQSPSPSRFLAQSLCYLVTLSPSHPITLSPHYRITLSPYHLITLSPSHPLSLPLSQPRVTLICWRSHRPRRPSQHPRPVRCTLNGSIDLRTENSSSEGQFLALTGLCVPSSLLKLPVSTLRVEHPRVARFRVHGIGHRV